MDLLDFAPLRFALAGFLILALMALSYFAFLGARAVFKQAHRLAREAGYEGAGAEFRAALHMAVWAALIVGFYLIAFAAGRRLGWWAFPPVAVLFVVTIGGLLLADRLLVQSARRGASAGLGVSLTLLLGLFVVAALML